MAKPSKQKVFRRKLKLVPLGKLFEIRCDGTIQLLMVQKKMVGKGRAYYLYQPFNQAFCHLPMNKIRGEFERIL